MEMTMNVKVETVLFLSEDILVCVLTSISSGNALTSVIVPSIDFSSLSRLIFTTCPTFTLL